VRTARRALVVLALMVAGLALMGGSASAHPLGNFTINTFDRLVVSPGEVRVDYVLDMAEIPTFEQMRVIDRDGDGAASASELAGYASARARELGARIGVTAGGRPVRLSVRSAAARLLPGQAGLHVLRLEAVLGGPLAGRTGTLTLADRTYAGHIGWHEVIAVGAGGAVVTGSSVPTRSVSQALSSYPKDLLADPLDVTSARVSFAPGHSGAAPGLGSGGDAGQRPGISGGAFAGLATWTGLTVPALLLALLLALAFGAGHALLPGHGKTLMAAYLVGQGGRLRQAVQVGVGVALMHTASVLVLGLAIFGLQVVAPDRIYPWITLATGLLILGMGTALVVLRLREARRRDAGSAHRHDHGHDHGHDDEHAHDHPPAGPALDRPLSRRGLAGLAVAGGLLPSPTAIVVLLATFSAHRATFGLALILAFSVGMAAALIAVGFLAFRARRAVSRRLSGRLLWAVPVVTALAIAVVGLVVSVKGAAAL